MQQVEHLIIGFGKAGKTLAQDLAKAGKSVILVEQSAKMYGGTCINVGCIPSKKMAYFAHERHANQNNDKITLQEAVDNKNTLISKLNQANYKKVADVATVITGHASFVDEHTVEVKKDDGETVTIKADNIYINTGAKNWQPPIDGLADSKFAYDSTSIMQLTDVPEQLVIIGGGYIGLEFAFTLAEFGSKVTILETADKFVPREDDEIAQTLQEIMQKKGITLKLGQKVEKIRDEADHAIVQTADGDLKANAILVSTGRRANIEGLQLDKAGVQVTDRGTVAVNDKLQTNVPHIWAMGDVAGSPQFTYISLDDYRVVSDQILGEGQRSTKDRTFPYAVFVQPPLANAGLTEKAAIEKGYRVKTAKLPAVNIPKAKILEQTDGLLKAVVDAKTDKILGVQLLCAEAHEIINFMDLAIKQGLTYQQVRDHIFTHPTMSEALNDLFGMIEK